MVSTTSPIHRLTLDDVIKMYDAGVLDELDRLELIDGVLVDMDPVGPEHEGATSWLNHHLHLAPAAHAWRVRVNATLPIPGGFLVPDLFVIEPVPRTEYPTTALLVVEVAQTSYARDRMKAARYAGIDVPDYWIVDIVAREVVVHREPGADGYAHVETFRPGQTIQPLVPDAPALDVAELLG